ncbi:ester cyclase [Patulibacter brassicae]|jgi:hypothetical protein|uniref:Ester cyclase n=1 Tax=Patulibacter brassicae TaxID=1705717 RepID=A0ABU4VLD5_9ACTN|nr:ester cyclase [Patulibacter brassicae]MDX8152280.1 ester cyclase [Patulibacter brassicae]
MAGSLDGDALARRILDAIGGRDRRLVADAVAHDVHYEDPFLPGPLRGPDALADHLALLWQAFPEGRVESTGPCLHDGGRIVALPLRLLGDHRGPLGPLPPTERFAHVHGMLVCELDLAGRRLWRARLFVDRYEACVQLGVLPEAGTVGDRAIRALQGFGILRGR